MLLWRFIVGSLGVAGFGPMALPYGGLHVGLTRVPIDASVHIRFLADRFAVFGDAGVTIVPVVAAGIDLPLNHQSAGVDAGARASIGLMVRASYRWWPTLALEASYLPSASPVEVNSGYMSAPPTGCAQAFVRHTFASHFVMTGGSILSLQKLLGGYGSEQERT